MATFALLVNSNLNFATLQALANTVRREITNPAQGPRSNQVASYVISHLSALAYHNKCFNKEKVGNKLYCSCQRFKDGTS